MKLKKNILLIVAYFFPLCALPAYSQDVHNCKIGGVPAEEKDTYLPGYSEQQIHLKLHDNGKEYESVNFVIFFDKNHLGHLQSQSNFLAPKREVQLKASKGLAAWPDRLLFHKTDKGWVLLDQVECTKLFGEPRFHIYGKSIYYVFDVFTDSPGREQQLYHIDAKFDGKGALISYRIRGLGICKPQWTTN